MPISVVVGGQYGSEGKGKVAHFLARIRGAYAAVRVGGSNSGHQAVDRQGNVVRLRHLPTPAIEPGIIAVIPAGALVDVDVLLDELSMVPSVANRLIIDPGATLITDEHRKHERKGGLKQGIGSTGSGTGAAVCARAARQGRLRQAKDEPRLAQYTQHGTTSYFLRSLLDEEKRIIVEGTQGYGLSVIHSRDYPYVTSRDTTAGTFVSESGVSPRDVDEVAMVIRAFPIRVAGKSGPLVHETSWDRVERSGGWPLGTAREYTTVTQRLRRIAEFDADIVRRALAVNRPDTIFLNHVDLFDHACANAGSVTREAESQIMRIEEDIVRSVDFIGVGPGVTLAKCDGLERTVIGSAL